MERGKRRGKAHTPCLCAVLFTLHLLSAFGGRSLDATIRNPLDPIHGEGRVASTSTRSRAEGVSHRLRRWP
ncbi:hypothetical protein FB451DRAFT_1255399 [Mycena latifolia]|nr:hypothetical protein FB451DRAFT_1255399 [Mycena latifolia]